jgi:hypothetical protein
MGKKQEPEPAPVRRNKIKRSYYFSADLLDRLQAYAATITPRTTDTAIMELALEEYLERNEGKVRK